MSRDWQKDMELAHTARYEYKIEHLNPVLDALFYWLQEVEKWRIEAFRKYPTPEAYETACAALHKHRERADKAEQERRMLTQTMLKGDRIITELREDLETTEAREQKLREAMEWVRRKFESEWTYEPGIGEVVDEIINRFDQRGINLPGEGTTP